MSTAILLRANHFGPSERTALSALKVLGLPVIVAADERNGQLETAPYPKVSLTEATVAALGLPTHPNMGWMCGDYSLSLLANEMPHIENVWLIEPDIRFHFKDIRTFFAAFSGSAADLVSMRFDLAPPDWHWTSRIEPFGLPARRMLFSGIRISRRAIAAVTTARRWLPFGLPPDLLPNDEALVATILGNRGFDCRTYAEFGSFTTTKSFNFAKPISAKWLDRAAPDDLVYHPVLYGEAFLRKAIAFIRRYPSYHHQQEMREGVERELGTAAAEDFVRDSMTIVTKSESR